MLTKLGPLLVICLGSTSAVAKNITIEVGGEARTAVYFKSKVRGGGPVVIFFHGHGSNGADSVSKTDLHAKWPEATMYFPDGLPSVTGNDPEGERSGWQKKLGTEGDRDLALFDAILAREGIEQETRLQGEPTRGKRTLTVKRKVYVAGFSNGGGFTVLLWSERRSSIAAIAVCAATGRADVSSPIPAVFIYGKNDKKAEPEKTLEAIRDFLVINKAIKTFPRNWPKGRVLKTYRATRGGADTLVVTHQGDHSWPKWVGNDVVRFFKTH